MVALASAGSRPAPEVLVLELFRELFYQDFSEGPEQRLEPANEEELSGEKGAVVMEVVRGRQRLQKGAKAASFYAPAYPEQAETAWLRRQSDRSIRDHFLRGPIAEGLKGKSNAELEHWAERLVEGLLGTNRGEDEAPADLLWAGISGRPRPASMLSNEDAKQKVFAVISKEPQDYLVPGMETVDPLAGRILRDLDAIIALEPDVARMQWIDLLKSFLRFSTSIWLLSRMQIMGLVHGWLMDAASGNEIPPESEICERIASRSASLLHPTREASSERVDHVSRYVKARIETYCLLNKLGTLDASGTLEKRLTVRSTSSVDTSISQVLELARKHREKLAEDGRTIVQTLTREAETYAGWYKPLRVGVGKNIDEFLRVLRRLEGDNFDQAYLESQEGKRIAGRTVIFPGPALLRMIVLLASRDEIARKRSSSSKLLLSDIEKHFLEYGVDFSSSAVSRPRMIDSLKEQGLLRGSPDAGDSVEVSSPFQGGES